MEEGGEGREREMGEKGVKIGEATRVGADSEGTWRCSFRGSLLPCIPVCPCWSCQRRCRRRGTGRSCCARGRLLRGWGSCLGCPVSGDDRGSWVSGGDRGRWVSGDDRGRWAVKNDGSQQLITHTNQRTSTLAASPPLSHPHRTWSLIAACAASSGSKM